MKPIVILSALALLLVGPGCGHVDLASSGNPERVLNGSVRVPSTLPAGAEILVQVMDTAVNPPPAAMMKNDLPIADRPRPALASPRLLGEQRVVLSAATIEPVAFKVDYRASDDELRHGLNIDVRVSYGGRVRFRTISAYVITLASSPFPHEVPVQPLE